MAQLTPDARAQLEAFKAVVVKKAIFARITKSIVTGMTPLLKLPRRAMRTELRQKAIYSPFARPAGVREKRFNVAWKRFVAELLSSKLP